MERGRGGELGESAGFRFWGRVVSLGADGPGERWWIGGCFALDCLVLSCWAVLPCLERCRMVVGAGGGEDVCKCSGVSRGSIRTDGLAGLVVVVSVHPWMCK
jgi:hypothetical protein